MHDAHDFDRTRIRNDPLVVVKLAEYIPIPGGKNIVHLEDVDDDDDNYDLDDEENLEDVVERDVYDSDDANLDDNFEFKSHLMKQDVWLSKSAWQIEHLKEPA